MNNYVIKHSAAIHITNRMSAVDRKIFNVLLENSFRQMKANRTFEITLKELQKTLGWGDHSQSNDNIKQSLKNLVSTAVEWNIFRKDKMRNWGVFSLLGSASISNGVICYAYNEELREYLAAPNVYAKLNLAIQRDIASKHALSLWEFFVDYLSLEDSDQKMCELSVENLKKLLDLSDSSTYESFKRLNDKVIKPACDEINAVSEMNVIPQYVKSRRSVTCIIFKIEKKKNIWMDESKQYCQEEKKIQESREALNLSVYKLGISESCFKKMVEKYDEVYVCDVLSHISKVDTFDIKNMDAYFITVLRLGIFSTDKTVLKHNPNLEQEKKCIIENFKMHQDRAEIFCKRVGGGSFCAWLGDADIEASNLLIKITFRSNFSKDYFCNKLYNTMFDVFGNDISISLCTKDENKKENYEDEAA